jgi:hypothetical protein
LTIILTTLSSQGVSVDGDPLPLPEAGPRAVTVTLGLHDTPVAFTFTADEVRRLAAELAAVVTFAD